MPPNNCLRIKFFYYFIFIDFLKFDSIIVIEFLKADEDGDNGCGRIMKKLVFIMEWCLLLL